MEFQYPKPKRFLIDGMNKISEKRYLTKEEARYLLSGRVIVEEKMDGRPGIFECRDFLFCVEDLKRRHTISYRVPARYAVYDIFDIKRNVFLTRGSKDDVLRDFLRKRSMLPEPLAKGGIFSVQLLEKGKFKLADLPALVGISDFAFDHDTKTKEKTYMEGIVVKPDRELFLEEHLSGKLIRLEFTESINKHYLRLPLVLNIIDPNINKSR